MFFNGRWFNTTEAAFQAAKCLDEDDAARIAAQPTPGRAKRLGRKVQIHPNWESVKVDQMLSILRIKFTRGSEFADKLEATGNQKLVEGNHWHDCFWGVCTCPKCNSTGTNMLGQILMHIRRENREGQFFPFRPFTKPRADWIFPE